MIGERMVLSLVEGTLPLTWWYQVSDSGVGSGPGGISVPSGSGVQFVYARVLLVCVDQ